MGKGCSLLAKCIVAADFLVSRGNWLDTDTLCGEQETAVKASMALKVTAGKRQLGVQASKPEVANRSVDQSDRPIGSVIGPHVSKSFVSSGPLDSQHQKQPPHIVSAQ